MCAIHVPYYICDDMWWIESHVSGVFYCESWFWQNHAVKLTGHNHNLKSFVGRQLSFWIKRPIFRNKHSPSVFAGPNSIANLEVTEGGMGPTKPTENLSDAPGASPMTFMTAVALSSSAWTRSRRALIRSVTWRRIEGPISHSTYRGETTSVTHDFRLLLGVKWPPTYIISRYK